MGNINIDLAFWHLMYLWSSIKLKITLKMCIVLHLLTEMTIRIIALLTFCVSSINNVFQICGLSVIYFILINLSLK